MAPILPYPINGTIRNANGIAISNARITLTITSGSVSGATNSTGTYLLDLANAGTYSDGETITYSVTEPVNNELASGSITVTGGGQTLNVSTSLREDTVNPPGVNDIQLHKIGGEIVTQNNPLPVESLTQTGKLVQYDTSTRAATSITYGHHEIHSGSSFTLSHNADVANDGTCDILLITPNTTKWAHFIYEVDVENEAEILIYEAPTATAGTALVIYNRNRNSATTATVTASHTPTSITPGTTIIRTYHLGSGKAVGGGARGAHEFILKANTKYLFRVHNETASANQISIKLDWYEHTNKGV